MGATTGFEGCITHGPWGTQGKSWIYMPEGFIERISIAHGGVIDSIKFQSCNTGETQDSFFGGKGGNKTDTIIIDYPKEYLVAISGTTGNYDGYNVVKSLCIVTNKKRYGPYGTDSGTRFSYDGKCGVIVGFHGHGNKYLEAIGVYVKPESLALAKSSTCQSNSVLEGLSIPPSSSSGPSTPLSSSPGLSGSATSLGKAKCSNCKLLALKIKILEATLVMERHPENHTYHSVAILHELLNDVGKLCVE